MTTARLRIQRRRQSEYADFQAGMTIRQIAEKYGLAKTTVRNDIKVFEAGKLPYYKEVEPSLTRIMRFVVKDINIAGCWGWTGYITPAGYAQVWYNGRRNEFGHRALYMELVGPIPEGLHLDHLCRNRWCVNPAHVEPVTIQENLRRGNSPNAISFRTNRCYRGHEFTPENTYIAPKKALLGKRECRTCRNARTAAWTEKRREMAKQRSAA